MRRLRSNSRENRIYKVFREVGRSVRTVALLRYLADPHLRARITAATNKVESYNGFAQWLFFGSNGVLADNDPPSKALLGHASVDTAARYFRSGSAENAAVIECIFGS